jgi:hypothetical protein
MAKVLAIDDSKVNDRAVLCGIITEKNKMFGKDIKDSSEVRLRPKERYEYLANYEDLIESAYVVEIDAAGYNRPKHKEKETGWDYDCIEPAFMKIVEHFGKEFDEIATCSFQLSEDEIKDLIEKVKKRTGLTLEVGKYRVKKPLKNAIDLAGLEANKRCNGATNVYKP